MVQKKIDISAYWLWTGVSGFGGMFVIAIIIGLMMGIFDFMTQPGNSYRMISIVIIALLSGLIQGILIGNLQWTILHNWIPVNRFFWVFLTTLVAIIGWLAGCVPSLDVLSSTSDTLFQTNDATINLLMKSLIFGIGLGVAFGIVQWFELKSYVKRAWTWIIANAIGWSIALMIITLAFSLPVQNTALLIIILRGLFSGLLAGLFVGSVTGIALLTFYKSKI
ncbi:MAG: hypothetical protein WCO06_03285 [Candidatus Roizmanbacteria bacterium]